VDIYRNTLIGGAQNQAGSYWLEQDFPHVERILDIPAYGRHHWYNRFTLSLSSESDNTNILFNERG